MAKKRQSSSPGGRAEKKKKKKTQQRTRTRRKFRGEQVVDDGFIVYEADGIDSLEWSDASYQQSSESEHENLSSNDNNTTPKRLSQQQRSTRPRRCSAVAAAKPKHYDETSDSDDSNNDKQEVGKRPVFVTPERSYPKRGKSRTKESIHRPRALPYSEKRRCGSAAVSSNKLRSHSEKNAVCCQSQIVTATNQGDYTNNPLVDTSSESEDESDTDDNRIQSKEKKNQRSRRPAVADQARKKRKILVIMEDEDDESDDDSDDEKGSEELLGQPLLIRQQKANDSAEDYSSSSSESNSDEDFMFEEKPDDGEKDSSSEEEFMGGEETDDDDDVEECQYKERKWDRDRAFYCCPICYVECYRRLDRNIRSYEVVDDDDIDDDTVDGGVFENDLELHDFEYGPFEVLQCIDPQLRVASAFCFQLLSELKEHLRHDHAIDPREIDNNELFMRFTTAKADGLVQRFLKKTTNMERLGYMDGYFRPCVEEVTTLRELMRRRVGWRKRLLKGTTGQQEVLNFGEEIVTFWSSFSLRSHRIWRALKQAYDKDESGASSEDDEDGEEEGEPINHDLIDRQAIDQDGEEAEVAEFVEAVKQKHGIVEEKSDGAHELVDSDTDDEESLGAELGSHGVFEAECDGAHVLIDSDVDDEEDTSLQRTASSRDQAFSIFDGDGETPLSTGIDGDEDEVIHTSQRRQQRRCFIGDDDDDD